MGKIKSVKFKLSNKEMNGGAEVASANSEPSSFELYWVIRQKPKHVLLPTLIKLQDFYTSILLLISQPP